MAAPPALGPRVLVPVADGAEEAEAAVLADVLRRGGVQVRMVPRGRAHTAGGPRREGARLLGR